MAPQSSLSISELARRCAEETDRFGRKQGYDPSFCYELFRLALVDQDEQAWAALHDQYQRLVRSWLASAPGDTDSLVNETFARFWQALRGRHFESFESLGALVAYLHRCAQSVAVEANRQLEHARRINGALVLLSGQPMDSRANPIDPVIAEADSRQVYEHVMQCLNSDEERLVFLAACEWDLPPRAIAERWPARFADAHEVSRIKERIFRRLQRDEELRALLGLQP